MNEVIKIRDKNHGAVPESQAELFFYGDEGKLFLAPRGLHAVDGKLIVAILPKTVFLSGTICLQHLTKNLMWCWGR